MDLIPIRRALISVADKTGLLDLAAALAKYDVELLASGGTKSTLAAAGYRVIEVGEYTGQPEMLGGRVKTLHPKIHGGILARRDVEEDLAASEKFDFGLIDLVVVNFYPFEAATNDPNTSLGLAIENIDIGGPSMMRSAAKNFQHVAILSNPDQYPSFAVNFEKDRGTRLQERQDLATKAFQLTARYDLLIANYLADHFQVPSLPDSLLFPAEFNLSYRLKSILRYGENPHQKAALYSEPDGKGANLLAAKILHGKELSYNNILDLDSVLRLTRLFTEPAAVIFKHNNPCGASEAKVLRDAFELAYLGDPVSAFGGIVGVNRRLDLATAERICAPGRFIEAILAPSFDEDAYTLITTKPTWKNSVRLVSLEGLDSSAIAARPPGGFDLRRIEGGLLVQDWDLPGDESLVSRVVTDRSPDEAERASLEFAWKVSQSVKSNAIVLVNNQQVVGVGAGQSSRLDSVKIALAKAGDLAKGAVLASDAFFPFPDGPLLAALAGVTAMVQPGGSKRDAESISVCNEHQIAMIFTDRRHFRH